MGNPVSEMDEGRQVKRKFLIHTVAFWWRKSSIVIVYVNCLKRF